VGGEDTHVQGRISAAECRSADGQTKGIEGGGGGGGKQQPRLVSKRLVLTIATHRAGQ